MRFPNPPVALTNAVIEKARARELADATTQSARNDIAAKYQAKYLPKSQPAFSALLAGFGDELWIERFAEDPTALRRYVVVSEKGALVARVSAASQFRVIDVGRDYVAGIYKDVDGLESVRVYELTR